MVKDINEHYDIRSFRPAGKMTAVKWFDRYIGTGTNKHIQSSDFDIRPPLADEVTNQPISATDIQNTCPLRD